MCNKYNQINWEIWHRFVDNAWKKQSMSHELHVTDQICGRKGNEELQFFVPEKQEQNNQDILITNSSNQSTVAKSQH